ncbi:uncharacterized protein PG986_015034 [Apiospora aurea]|uniref:Uncharacterized protein n=1 Tax=Apiospora aurea TaxID=335848 RepID=A0ABR1PRQ3_9PEZI
MADTAATMTVAAPEPGMLSMVQSPFIEFQGRPPDALPAPTATNGSYCCSTAGNYHSRTRTRCRDPGADGRRPPSSRLRTSALLYLRERKSCLASRGLGTEEELLLAKTDIMLWVLVDDFDVNPFTGARSEPIEAMVPVFPLVYPGIAISTHDDV